MSLRKVSLFAAVAAFAVTALGAPASAADTTGTLVIVQGIPNQRVDICIGNKEQRSGKAYGSKYEKDVIGTGTRLLRFFKYDPNKTCGGTLIARKRLNITPGWDKTVVLTRFAPKIVLFDNANPWLGEIPPRGGDFPYHAGAWRNGSDLLVDFYYKFWDPNGPVLVNPASWDKGSNMSGHWTGDYFYGLYATLDGASPFDYFAERTYRLKPGRRFEVILIGTSTSNARFVAISRRVSDLSP